MFNNWSLLIMFYRIRTKKIRTQLSSNFFINIILLLLAINIIFYPSYLAKNTAPTAPGPMCEPIVAPNLYALTLAALSPYISALVSTNFS